MNEPYWFRTIQPSITTITLCNELFRFILCMLVLELEYLILLKREQLKSRKRITRIQTFTKKQNLIFYLHNSLKLYFNVTLAVYHFEII